MEVILELMGVVVTTVTKLVKANGGDDEGKWI